MIEPLAAPAKLKRSSPLQSVVLETLDRAACPAVVASATALPEHEYDQRELASLSARILGDTGYSEASLARFFDHVGVKSRHLALPVEAYETLRGFGARSRAWMDVALRIGSRAVCDVLHEAGLNTSEVGMLMTTTVTGIAVPSLDARLMNVLPLASDLKRVPLFGLGCLGGAAGLARASEYLLAFPDQAALLLSVELCSLTFQRDDVSVANLISVGLFAGLLFAGIRRSHAGTLLTAVGFGSSLLVAMGTIAAAPAVNEAFSTKTILASAADLPESAGRNVFFPLTEDYSAEFYEEAFLGGHIEHQRHKGLTLLVQKLQQPSAELFVFRRNAWDELEPAIRESLELATETPHWVACRSRVPAPHEAARITLKATASGN